MSKPDEQKAERELAEQQTREIAETEELAKATRASGGIEREFVSVTAEIYSGILPHPDFCARMEELCPGFTDRILTMAETQMTHRIEIEKRVVFGGSNRADRGLNYGLIITLSFLVIAAGLVALGHDASGTTIGSIDLVALVGVFVYGRQEQKNERIEKAERLEQVRHAIEASGRGGGARVSAQGAKEGTEGSLSN